MTWDPGNPDIAHALTEAGAPPAELEALFEDETWTWIFGCWSADLDQDANRLYLRLREGEAPSDQVREQFRDDYLVRFREDAEDLRVRSGWATMNARGDDTISERTDIDDTAVEEINRRALEQLRVDGEVEYRQVGELVLIGEEQPWSYYNWACAQPGYGGGTITMRSRRGAPTAPTTDDEGGALEDVQTLIEVTGCEGAANQEHFEQRITALGSVGDMGMLTRDHIAFR
jgi:hypothetical protein